MKNLRMIDSVTGKVRVIYETGIACNVGGFCWMVQVPQPSLYAVGDDVTLMTHMHWNAEQGPSLFGFATDLERTVFLLVTSCSGIGPKIGLASLKNLTAASIVQMISLGDYKGLSSVPGIGLKKAEQIVVQLRSKVNALLKSGVIAVTAKNGIDMRKLSEVLTSLSYSHSEIDRALQFVQENTDNAQPSFDHVLRQALSFLAKKA